MIRAALLVVSFVALVARQLVPAAALLIMSSSSARAQSGSFEELPALEVNTDFAFAASTWTEAGVFTIDDGQRVQLVASSGSLSEYQLVDAHGRVVASKLFAPFPAVRLIGGEYLVRVRAGSAGLARIAAFDDAEGTAELDLAVTGTATVPGSEHRYAITSPGGTFEVHDGGAVWRIEDAAGHVVRSEIIGGFALQAGAYDLVVGGGTFSGDYEVVWTTEAVPSILTLGSVVADTLPVGRAHTFTYLAASAQELELTGVPLGARVRVFDPVGTRVIDEVSRGIPHPLALGAGEHLVEIANAGIEALPYALLLDVPALPPSPPPATVVIGPVVLGVPVAGQIVLPTYSHSHTFEVVSETTVVFTVDARRGWALRDPQGQVRPVSGPMRLSPGTWTVEVYARSSWPLAYSILVQDLAEQPLVLGGPATATLAADDALLNLSFALTEEARVRIMPQSSTWTLDGRIVDADGVVWASGQLSGAAGWAVTLPPGSFQLVASRRAGIVASTVASTTFLTAFCETVAQELALGDEVQGLFLQPHGLARYDVRVEADDTPFQVSVIQTFSYGGGAVSDYTMPVKYGLTDPYGNVVRPMASQNSGTHSPVWVLDEGDYLLEVSSVTNTSYTTPVASEWDLKVRGVPEPAATLWFGHDDNYPIAGPAYGIGSVDVAYDATGQLQLGAVVDQWATNWMWTMLWAPDGDAVYTQELLNRLVKVDVTDDVVAYDQPIGVRAGLQGDPSGLKVWIPAGSRVGEASLYPFGTLIWHTTSGDDGVGGWTTDGQGRHWYASAPALDGTITTAHYGLVDLDTFQTDRQFSILGGGGIVYDAFSDTLLVSVRDELHQIDPDTLAVVSVLDTDPGNVLDDRLVAFMPPVVDGEGRLFLLSPLGRGLITMVDYAASGLVGDPSNELVLQHFDRQPIAIAPLVGAGSPCYAPAGVVDFDPAPGSLVPAGETVLLTGTAEMRDLTRPVEAVVVNGVPVPVDVTGTFFAAIPIVEGPQTITVELYDRCGSVAQTLELVGTTDPTEIPLAFSDVTYAMSTVFRDATWDLETRTLSVDVLGTNTGDAVLRGPLRLVVGPDDERVQLDEADTVGTDGRPAVTLLAPGATLAPGESLALTRLTFRNTGQVSLRADARWEYAGNQAPSFTSAPTLEAVAEQSWTYDADATDVEGDALSFSTEQAPIALTIDPVTGALSWTPTGLDAGLHPITVVATDDRGGVAKQTFSLHVRLPDQNQPPIFTSVPPSDLLTSASLVYAPTAVDIEGDPLTFSLVEGPVGAALDPATGQLTWTGAAVDGLFPFELAVADGRGGEATQAFVVSVSAEPAFSGGAPLITSFPPLEGSVGGLYAYIPTATDPDGDVLDWWLVEAPDGLGIDPATGRLLWSPELEDVGAHDVELAVTDGTNTSTQRWQIAVADGPPNFSPVFATAPVLSAAVGTLYAYDADADDPEGADLAYDLFSGPADALVDPETGLVTWSPTAVGEVPFVVRATDPGGAAALQAWVVRVRAGNAAPVVFVDAAAIVPEDFPWDLQAQATDADGDPLTFSLRNGGPFAIDPLLGLISGLPTSPQSYLIDVVATDTLGAEGVAQLQITVVADVEPPEVDVQVAGVPCANATSEVCVVAVDQLKPLRSVTLTRNGVNVALDAIKCANVTWGAAGVGVTLVGRAQEAAGLLGGLAATDTVVVVPEVCPVTPPAPPITIVSPVDGDRLGVPDDIVVTTTLPVASWRVLVDDAVLAEGTGALPATLGTFDPTLLANGLSTLTIEITDTAGVVHVAESSVLVDGAMKLGSFEVAWVDASWTTSIANVSMVRSYTTLRKDQVGDFGHGWSLGATDMTVRTNGPLGKGGWRQYGCGFGMIFSPVCFATTKPHLVAVTWPDGRVEAFDATPEETSTFMPLFGRMAFTPRPGTTSSIEVADFDSFLIAGQDLLEDVSLGGWFDPELYVLTDAGGVQYVLSVADGLLETVDRSGHRTQYTDEGIFPDIGLPLTWTRDADGRITELSLADGSSLTYAYDAAGDLVSVTDPAGAVVELGYDAEHRLVSYNDAGHPAAAVLAYDADGRLISRTDAAGVTITTSADLEAWTQTVVGPDPSLTTTTYFNADGLRTYEFIEFEDRIFASSWEYDGNHRLVSETSAGGADRFYSYDDAGHLVLEEDPDGHVTERLYDSFGNVTEVRINGWLVERREFDGITGNLLRELMPSGASLREYAYDEDGALSSWVDADGVAGEAAHNASGAITHLVQGLQSHDMAVDSLGRVLAVTDSLGSTEQRTLDARGDAVSYTNPSGLAYEYVRDDRGLVVAIVDPTGAVSTYSWDDARRLTSRTNRDGETVTYTYDLAGRLARVDGGGDAWVNYGYDARGFVTRVENAELVIQRSWTPDGLVSREVSTPVEAGSHPALDVSYEWTAAGRLKRVTTEQGTFEWTYDEMGAASQVLDSFNGPFSWQWQDDGVVMVAGLGVAAQVHRTPGWRVQRTEWTDPTETSLGALDITRDSGGRVATRSDAFGVHTYLHDAAGRLLSADHPDGAGITDEAYAYDPAGNRTLWTGHDADEVGYDDAGRLVRDAEYAYVYDAEGRLVSREESATGALTLYEWDALDRMRRIEHSDGTETRFTYDGWGRRIELNDRGQVFRFGYDRHLRSVFDETNQLTTWYTADREGHVLAERDVIDGQTRIALRDPLGSRVGWVDETGLATWAPRDSFGNSASAPTDLEPGALTWHSQDPTGLVYARARYLDPLTGRFLSEDPVPAANLYAYAANDPLNTWDPDGRETAAQYSVLSWVPGASFSATLRALGPKLIPIIPVLPVLAHPSAVPPPPEPQPEPEKEPDKPPQRPRPKPADEPCKVIPLGYHKGADAIHNACADSVPPNRYPGSDAFVKSKAFDAISAGEDVLWEFKTQNWRKFPPKFVEVLLAKEVPKIYTEAGVAASCGYPFILAIAEDAQFRAFESALSGSGISVLPVPECL